jgi:hypothetical protein
MPNRRAVPSKKPPPGRSQQISGEPKDAFIRGLLQQVPDLDEGLAAQVAERLCSAIRTVDPAIIERYGKPRFDPNAFSLMKVYRTSGERGLRERLSAIEESRDLQALARAQQISLPQRLRSGSVDPSGLKEAIVKGVIGRHNDWRAAS